MSEHREVALQALRSYDVTPQRVRLAAESFNSVFRVTTDAAVYALRVGSVWVIHPRPTAAVEAAWHNRLRRHGVPVPGVRANREGEVVTLVTDGEGRPRICVLLDWVSGRSLRTCLTLSRAAGLGRLAARLHQDAAGWSPPGAGEVLRADRVLYWQVPERLTMAGPRFGYGSLFADAVALARESLDWLWRHPPHPPHLLHGDLTPQNVIVSPGAGLVPIDFQDMVLGFEVQDLAFSIARLRREPGGGGRLIEAFRRGYSESRPWPEVPPDVFEALIAARNLHMMNLVLNNPDLSGLDGYVAVHAERTRAWMQSAETKERG